jgi:hypothetical protein
MVPMVPGEPRGWGMRGILWRSAMKSVHAAGIIERLPSGRIRVKCRTPWRWMQLNTSRVRP